MVLVTFVALMASTGKQRWVIAAVFVGLGLVGWWMWGVVPTKPVTGIGTLGLYVVQALVLLLGDVFLYAPEDSETKKLD